MEYQLNALGGTGGQVVSSASGVGSSSESSPAIVSPVLGDKRTLDDLTEPKRKSKFTAKHTTNRHHFKDKFERKRKANVRACDACATRKVKCETQRPCSHCTTNGLQCTQLRERKKSGPKSLSRYALDLIGVLEDIRDKRIEVIPEEIEIKPEAATGSVNITSIGNGSLAGIGGNSASIASGISSIGGLVTAQNNDYVPTPHFLMENVTVIISEPIMFTLFRPSTVESLTLKLQSLLDFLSSNYSTVPNREINLMAHHDDSIFLTKLLLVHTINLLVSEALIKLKKQKFKDFLKYPKKNLLQRNYKRYRNLCHMKCLEIILLVEKNFLVPAIGPPGPLKVENTNNSFQVYYNLSLSCLHMCNYNHILNLTNTLNTNSHMENNFGNEMQEHQKLMYLRKSIAYYQLINLKSNEEQATSLLHELYEELVTAETFYLIYLSNNYNLSLLRNNDIIVQLKCDRYGRKNPTFLSQLMNTVRNDEVLDRLTKLSNSNVMLRSANDLQVTYPALKSSILQLTTTEPIFEVIKIILIFKTLLIYPMDDASNKVELCFLIGYANHNLDHSNLFLFKQQMLNYQLLQPMLHLLKIMLDLMAGSMGAQTDASDIFSTLIQYSDNLIKHFPFFNNINKLIRSSKVLNDWFLKLNDLRSSMKSSMQYSLIEAAQIQAAHVQATHIASRSQNSTPVTKEKSYKSPDDLSDESEQELYIGSRQTQAPAPTYSDYVPPDFSYTPNFLSTESQLSMTDLPAELLQQPTKVSMEGLDSFTQFPISASTKSLYNLFTHIDDFDGVPGASPNTKSMHDSLTNLFQFNQDQKK